MASVMISPPGSEFGPCLSQDKPCCTHIDCAQTRAMAESLCTACNLPIGYEVQFFGNRDATGRPDGTFIHAVCEYERIETMGNGRISDIQGGAGFHEFQN